MIIEFIKIIFQLKYHLNPTAMPYNLERKNHKMQAASTLMNPGN